MKDALVRRLIKPGIILVVFAAASLGYYHIRKSSMCNAGINEIFDVKTNLDGIGYAPDCREKAIAFREIGIPYNPQSPREFTSGEKRLYLKKVHGIELDDWGEIIGK